MSALSVSTSMILPLPSSPHWAPTRIVFAIVSGRAPAIKIPEMQIRGGALSYLPRESKETMPGVSMLTTSLIPGGGVSHFLIEGEKPGFSVEYFQIGRMERAFRNAGLRPA